MAVGSTTDPDARNWTLDAAYGDNHGSLFPDSIDFGLFHGDPTGSGTELTSTGGYVRVTLANTTAVFSDAVDGVKTIAALVQFPISTAAYSDTADYWALITPDVGDGEHLLDSGLVVAPSTTTPTPLNVDSSGLIARFAAGTVSIAVT